MNALREEDRDVLRAAIGEENFPDLVAVCERLDSLGTRLAISSEGMGRLMRALAEELVAQRLAIEVANDSLPMGSPASDTLRPGGPLT